jgi:hypothetical protein
MVYVAELGDKAAEAGVAVGDVITGVSFVFGDDFLANMTGKVRVGVCRSGQGRARRGVRSVA